MYTAAKIVRRHVRLDRPGRLGLALGVLWLLTAGALPTFGVELSSTGGAPATSPPVRHILLLQVAPRAAPALLAQEQAFVNTLKAVFPEPVTFHSEYLELAMFDQPRGFEKELVGYLAAKYARTKLDLVVAVTSSGLKFAVRHRSRLFPGVPIVFNSVDRQAAADIPLAADISGVWLSMDWVGTLEAARRLQPDIEQVVVVTGASAVDKVWEAAAREQLERLPHPISVTYLTRLSIEAVVERLGALPDRSVVLLGAFQTDATGRRFLAPETTPRFSAASRVPIYTLGDASFGHGTVGGHLISFELQGRRCAELAMRVLRGERPPPMEMDTHVFRFDARQLRRWRLDTRRLPPGSEVVFGEPSLWQAYRGYVLTAIILLGVQTWLIIVLLANRVQRRRAQRALAEQLRFETLISDVLAGQLTLFADDVENQVQRALALIGADLGADRIVLAEGDPDRRTVNVTHAWARGDVHEIPSSIEWRAFPWMARRLGEGNVVVVSPLHPLPPEASKDRETMLAYSTRSMLAVPLVVEGRVVGALSCSTVTSEREWAEALIERLRLLAKVFASMLARRRAETAAREIEERFHQQRQDLTHALRVNTLGELGASLAHEINQPLSAILMNASAMSTLLKRGAGEQTIMNEALADIAADAKRAGEIIHRLRALSRKEHVAQHGLSLDALVDGVIELLHQEFVRRDVVVRRVAAPWLPPLTGDPIQLQQIVLNLLVNAAEALEGAERGNREITVTTGHPTPGLLELAVRDTGVGGKEVDLERMFGRFVTTKPGGLGMGLAISRSIVEAHGGRIYAKANCDRGLTVCVELPAEA